MLAVKSPFLLLLQVVVAAVLVPVARTALELTSLISSAAVAVQMAALHRQETMAAMVLVVRAAVPVALLIVLGRPVQTGVVVDAEVAALQPLRQIKAAAREVRSAMSPNGCRHQTVPKLVQAVVAVAAAQTALPVQVPRIAT